MSKQERTAGEELAEGEGLEEPGEDMTTHRIPPEEMRAQCALPELNG
jgi:hypothetical protein